MCFYFEILKYSYHPALPTYQPLQNIKIFIFNAIYLITVYLEGKVVILLLLFGSQSVPPFAQYFTDGAVVLVRVSLMHQRTVTLTKDHEGVHRPSDVVLFPLWVGVNKKEEKQ